MKTRICLIRHGVTEANQKRLYYGSSDIPLSKEGINAIQKLASEGIYPDDDNAKYYTTGMLRTEQTFSLIYGDCKREVLSFLRELDFGDFEMKGYEELKSDPDYQAWIRDTDGTVPPPGGERTCDFRSRVLDGFADLLKKQREGMIVTVCHGGPIAEILQNAFPDEKASFYQWLPEPGHGYLLTAENGKITEKESF